MQSTKIIKLLKTFSEDEMKSFEKFIASPFHNSVKKHQVLFKELKKFHPQYTGERLSYEYIFKKLYRGKAFNKQIIWNLMSGFEKLAENFLLHLGLQKNNFEGKEFLIWELFERKLLNNYMHTINEMDIQLDKEGIEYMYFEKKGHLEMYKQFYYISIDKIQHTSDSKLKASEYQILQCLRMTVSCLSDLSVLTSNHNSSFDMNIPLEFAKCIDIKNVAVYATERNYEYAFLLDIYYHSLMMFLKPRETEHINRVRKLYEINFKKFTMSEKRAIMYWILNYYTVFSGFEGIELKKVLFELNEFRLREGLVFFPAGQIPKANYFSILNTALSLNKIEWSENFIKKYTSMIQHEIRESVRAIAYASLHFETKEYEKVLLNLNTIVFSDTMDKLQARSLVAKTYYEQRQFETLLDHIDSSKHFLKTNRSVSKLNEEFYGNFYNFIKKLISVNENADLHSIPVLKKEILATIKLGSKNWLLEKIKELGV